ncbi:hypothetical protein AX16_007987 [Volvariella volvacea WC 439]|nr:hypothetical protein AX16_007987 [Volvariella volvacea WC 439]
MLTFSNSYSHDYPSQTQGSSAARAISELALRRRRSGGNTKSSKTRSNTLPANPLPAVLPHPPPPPPSLPSSSPLSQHSRIDVHPGDIQLKTPSKSTPTTPRLGPTPATNAPPLPHTLPIQAQPTASSSTAPIHPATIVTPAKSSDTFSAPKFSTADRTILEELRRNIIAREAHFVFKGPGLSASGVRVGKKHHSYPRKEVPYPRNFEREVLDL